MVTTTVLPTRQKLAQQAKKPLGNEDPLQDVVPLSF